MFDLAMWSLFIIRLFENNKILMKSYNLKRPCTYIQVQILSEEFNWKFHAFGQNLDINIPPFILSAGFQVFPQPKPC